MKSPGPACPLCDPPTAVLGPCRGWQGRKDHRRKPNRSHRRHLGGIAATNLKILSAKTITVTSPAGAGTAEVQVTTAGGTSPAVPADLYTYDGTAGGAIREASAHKSQPTQAAPISYSYNGDGLRMSETTVGSTTQFTWDTTPSTPEIIDDGSNYYIYGPGGIPIEQLATPNHRTTTSTTPSDQHARCWGRRAR